MGLVIDAKARTTDLVILDARNFEGAPQASIRVPHIVPPGFHGNWVPAVMSPQHGDLHVNAILYPGLRLLRCHCRSPWLPPVMAREPTGVRYDEIPADAYAVVAEVRARKGKEQELREATLILVAKVRAEPNNLLYFLHEDRESPGHFVFYEIFARPRRISSAQRHAACAGVVRETARQLADGGSRSCECEIARQSHRTQSC